MTYIQIGNRYMVRNILLFLTCIGFLLGCDADDVVCEIITPNQSGPCLVKQIATINLLSSHVETFNVNRSGRYGVTIAMKTKDNKPAYLLLKNDSSSIFLSGFISIEDEEQNLLITKEIKWRFNHGNLGATLFYFSVPEDIPKNHNLSILIIFNEVDKKIFESYDSLTIIIKRMATFLD